MPRSVTRSAVRLRLVAAGLVVLGAVAACGGAAATPSATPAATRAPAASPAPGASAAATDAASPGAVTKVNANTATRDEIAAALDAAGVPNASRWAREVEEYRPYPTDDPTLQKLQDNLAKYNPDAATLAGILAVLEP